MADLIVLVIIAAAVGSALVYIVKSKKEGKACIGCPSSGSCKKNCNCHK